jgi:hypothetical protein
MAEVRAKMQVDYSADAEDMSVLMFWEKRYLPYCEAVIQLFN